MRARLYALVREFFAERSVLEVETPILSVAANTEPNIESFSTTFSGPVASTSRQRWLRTSAEFPMKRLLAAGVGDCYELGRVFRNAESGRRHNPEFSMLEWYRVGWNHLQLIDETVDLVQRALALRGRKADCLALSYRDLFVRDLGIDPLTASPEQLQSALADFKIKADTLERDDWLDLLFTHRIQPEFPLDRITVVVDWPASQCSLAKIRPGSPPVAERFELFLGQYELANGYHELTDAKEQGERFENDNRRRLQRGQAELPIDHNLLGALARGMPECAGVALGIERLLMCLLPTDDIRDVLAFDFSRA